MPQTGRKILFILGAGASVAAGAYTQVQAGHRVQIPTQGTFWDVFLRLCVKSANRSLIENFLFQYFLGYERAPSNIDKNKRRDQLRTIDVEEVFTFISERTRARSTTPQLRTRCEQVWNALLEETGNVFARFRPNKQTKTTYRDLLSQYIRSRDAVVSFNYDTIFEHSLPSTQPWFYEGVNYRQNGLRVLKPHGSINWEGGELIKIRNKPKQAVIVAPTHLKFVKTDLDESDEEFDFEDAAPPTPGYLDQSPQIQDVWRGMEREMRSAKALVFIGYSFPLADLYFSSVLRSVLAARDATPAIVLVNPDAVAIQSRLKSRFPTDKMALYYNLTMFLQTDRDQLLRRFE